MNETTFYCFQGDQFIDAEIVIKSGSPKLNPATGKLELDDETIKKANFERGIYITSDEYEIEYLKSYNKGGLLSDGKRIKGTPFPTISDKNPKGINETIVEKVVEKEVIKKVIPESFINMLDIDAIIDLSKNDFNYEIENTDRKKIIKELKDKGFIV